MRSTSDGDRVRHEQQHLDPDLIPDLEVDLRDAMITTIVDDQDTMIDAVVVVVSDEGSRRQLTEGDPTRSTKLEDRLCDKTGDITNRPFVIETVPVMGMPNH